MVSAREIVPKASTLFIVPIIVLSSFVTLVSLVPEEAGAATVNHSLGNLDFQLTDYGRILETLTWNGVRQTPRIQASIPFQGSINEDSWGGVVDNQNGYDQGTPDIADSFNDFTPSYPAPADDYTVTGADTSIYFIEDSPSMQKSRASYTQTGTSQDANDLRIAQTAWTAPGDNFAIIEYKLTNIKGANIIGLSFGFHIIVSSHYYSPIATFDFGGPGGDGGDEVDYWDAGTSTYYVADNSGAGVSLGLSSADPSNPLDTYFAQPFAATLPTSVPSEGFLLYAMTQGNQLAWPTGCTPGVSRMCTVQTVVRWDVGNLANGATVTLPLVIAVNSTPGGMLTDVLTARSLYPVLNTNVIMTEVQDSSSPASRVEVYNYGTAGRTLTNWRIWTQSGGFIAGSWSPDANLPIGGYRTFIAGAGGIGPEGDIVRLYDDLNRQIDLLEYGQRGEPPDPINGQSTARIWDPVFLRYTDNWSMTLPGFSSPTFGSVNNVPPVMDLPELVLNEVCYNPSPACNGFIELRYLGTASIDLSLSNHFIVVDDIYTMSSGLMDQARALYFLNEGSYPVSFDMDPSGDNIYLYDSAGRLMDMVGWSAPHSQDLTLARVPEGNGTHGGFDDPSSIAAGWQFDQLPTYAVISLDRDQSGGGFPGETITFSLNVTNMKFDFDLVDLQVTESMGWPLQLMDSNWNPLTDTDMDTFPDVNLGPSETRLLHVNVSVPVSASDEMDNVTVNATSTTTSGSCPPGFDTALLAIQIYPHLNITKTVAPSPIYLNNTRLAPEEAKVTINLTGRGRPQITYKPQDVIFIIDSSGSMMTSDNDPNGPCNDPVNDPGPPPIYRPARVSAAWDYVNNLSGSDRGGYVDFDTVATLRVPLVLGTGADSYTYLKKDPANGLWCSDQVGGTLFTQALTLANNELIANGDPTHTKVEIFLTDGESNDWNVDWPNGLAQADIAAANGIVIFTIGLNVVNNPFPPSAYTFLNELAVRTGGQFFWAPDESALADIYKKIGLSIKNLAAKDPNPGDPLSPVVTDITPDYIEVLQPTINPGLPPDFISAVVNPDGTTSINWKIDSIAIGESVLFSYNVKSRLAGTSLNVTDWPDASVTYLRWDNETTTKPIPSAYVDVVAVDILPEDVLVNGAPPTAALPHTSVINQGTTNLISSVFSNLGTGDMPSPFNITFFNCTPGGASNGDPPLFETSIPSLLAGLSTLAYPILWTEPGTSNEYYVCIMADTLDVVGETDEANNLYILRLVTEFSDLIPGDTTTPDGILVNGVQVVDSDGTSPSEPISVGVSQTVDLSAMVSNIGASDVTADFNVTFYVSDNSTGVCEGDSVLDEWTVPGGLASGAVTGPFSTQWTSPPVSGDVWINVTVDSAFEVPEMVEQNNFYCIHFAVLPPDLIPGDMVAPVGILVEGDQVPDSDGITPSDPYPVGVDTLVDISLMVSNIGPSAAPSDFSVTLYLSDNSTGGCEGDSVLDSWVVSGGLASGTAAGPFIASWQSPATPQDVWMNVTVDSAFEVSEADEGNNYYCIHLNVSGLPDFIPYNGIDIGVNENNLSPDISGLVRLDLVTGQTIRLGSVVKNVGEAIAQSPFTYRVLLNATGSGLPDTANPLFSSAIQPPLAQSEETAILDYDWTAFSVPGQYLIFLNVDRGTNGDSEPANNTLTIRVNVHELPAPPVLHVDADDVGGNVTISWSPLGTGAWSYNLYWSTSPDMLDFTLLGNVVVPIVLPFGPISYVHAGAVALAPEVYYYVKSVNYLGWEGPSSDIVGKFTKQFPRGYSTFSLPLEPFEERSVSWYTEDMPMSPPDALYAYDAREQMWVGHPRLLAPGVDDFQLQAGEGYMAYAMRPFTYTFTGRPGTTIRSLNGTAQDPRVGTEAAFRSSLGLEVVPEGIRLNWSAPADVNLGTLFQPYETVSGYKVLRALNRSGFNPWAPYATTTATNFTDADMQEGERFYMIIPLNQNGRDGSSTLSAGAVIRTFHPGYGSFGPELRPSDGALLSLYLENGQDTDSAYYYDVGAQLWTGHPRLLPEEVDNPIVRLAEGYMLYAKDEIAVISIGK